MYANLAVDVDVPGEDRQTFYAWEVKVNREGHLIVKTDLNTDGESSYAEEGPIVRIPPPFAFSVCADY